MSTIEIPGLRKMKIRSSAGSPAQYFLALPEGDLYLNALLGKTLRWTYLGPITCIACSKGISKSFAQGFCYTCFRSLPEADLCMVSPERCHFDKGTCRDPEWGVKQCFIPHTVYLANSSGLKVGITRTNNEETRWLDQGAQQALPIVRVSKRLNAGLVEAELRKYVSDRSNWLLLLKQDAEPVDLYAKRDELLARLPDSLVYESLNDEEVRKYSYPILRYPEKVTSYDFLKTRRIEDTLIGIKGQYLLFEHGVLNVRKFAGYHVRIDGLSEFQETKNYQEVSVRV